MTTAMTVMQTEVPQVASDNIPAEVTATTPDEMSLAQTGMVAWFERKVKECEDEGIEARAAYEHAVSRKWSSSALKRMADRATKRVTFYRKVLEALRAGYVIVPNFPVSAFAIRTDRAAPLKMMTTNRWSDLEQNSPAKPVGEGEYRSPFPEIWKRVIEAKTQTTSEKAQYYAKAWEDLEFPLTMAKPQIMEAATRAMALKIFDDLAILPAARQTGDPMILARIFDGSDYKRGQFRKHVTFLIAWHLDLRTI